MKTLIIAEKPSVSRDIAAAVGSTKRNGDYFENDGYIISSAIGHLVELFMPEDIDKKLKFWRLESLPIIPTKFCLKPIERTKAKFTGLKKLMARRDVDRIVNACDAGREGELIFTYLYEAAGCKKPVERLWMQSMTQRGIRDAFSRQRSGDEMFPLRDAARCRSEADWLIGINGTRATTTRMYGSRRGQVATVGRVQTPTLTMVVERERRIRSFEPRTFWRLVGKFALNEGRYEGVYQRPEFKKSSDAADRPDRLWDRETAESLLADAKRADRAEVSEKKKRSPQLPPRLYDLTTLQREANNRFGFSARRTLQTAQNLYEKHKVLTYPRTDSRALPQDYVEVCRKVMGSLEGSLAEHAGRVLDAGWIKPNRRIFNDGQVSDHFAIIPTGQTPKSLNGDETRLFDLVARRFLAAFHPAAQFDVTTRISKVREHPFKTEGRVLVEPGWLTVYGRTQSGQGQIPAIIPADGAPPTASIDDISLTEDTTKPPPRYNEATLLSAMEHAGRLVDDEELAEAMKENGLGTPATRAQIIEHLIGERYLEREKRDLLPTAKAENLIEFLSAVKIEALTSPAMTGDWEHRLKLIENGNLTRESFMEGIREMTNQIVLRSKRFKESADEAKPTDILSPTDQQPIMETLRSYRSQDGTLTVYKVIGNRRLQEDELRTLLQEGQVGPMEGFRSKLGKPYTATLKLNEEHKVVFEFPNRSLSQDGGANPDNATVDIAQLTEVGKCPKGCADSGEATRVLETENAYVCENSLNGRRKCNFRISRTMLGRQLSRAQLVKLLQNGKTDLLEKFRSKRTHRFFSAHLVLKKDGGIEFEFPPRNTKKA